MWRATGSAEPTGARSMASHAAASKIASPRRSTGTSVSVARHAVAGFAAARRRSAFWASVSELVAGHPFLSSRARWSFADWRWGRTYLLHLCPVGPPSSLSKRTTRRHSRRPLAERIPPRRGGLRFGHRRGRGTVRRGVPHSGRACAVRDLPEVRKPPGGFGWGRAPRQRGRLRPPIGPAPRAGAGRCVAPVGQVRRVRQVRRLRRARGRYPVRGHYAQERRAICSASI